jgi:hypothetical protein
MKANASSSRLVVAVAVSAVVLAAVATAISALVARTAEAPVEHAVLAAHAATRAAPAGQFTGLAGLEL